MWWWLGASPLVSIDAACREDTEKKCTLPWVTTIQSESSNWQGGAVHPRTTSYYPPATFHHRRATEVSEVPAATVCFWSSCTDELLQKLRQVQKKRNSAYPSVSISNISNICKFLPLLKNKCAKDSFHMVIFKLLHVQHIWILTTQLY